MEACAQDFDLFLRKNQKPLKSLNFRVGEERNEWTFQIYKRSHCCEKHGLAEARGSLSRGLRGLFSHLVVMDMARLWW